MSFSSNSRMASPAISASSFFSSPVAGFEELKGSVIPKASIAEAIVLAVYIPPQAPAPGHAFSTIVSNSDSDIVPATLLPQASKAETISNFSPL